MPPKPSWGTGVPVSLIVFFVAKKRKTAILVPAVFSGIALLVSCTSVWWGYSAMRRHLDAAEADGAAVGPEELADGYSLLWFAAGQGAVVCIGLLCSVALAVLLKRDKEQLLEGHWEPDDNTSGTAPPPP